MFKWARLKLDLTFSASLYACSASSVRPWSLSALPILLCISAKSGLIFIAFLNVLIAFSRIKSKIATVLAKSVKSLTIFQRTPNYSIPARNRKLTKSFVENTKKNYLKIKNLLTKTPGGHGFHFAKKSIFEFNETKRLKILDKAWLNGGLSFRACFSDITKKLSANKIVSNYIRDKIINIVKDKEIAKKLTDFGHPFTSKRPTLNTNYFETFNRKNVRLIDL